MSVPRTFARWLRRRRWWWWLVALVIVSTAWFVAVGLMVYINELLNPWP